MVVPRGERATGRNQLTAWTCAKEWPFCAPCRGCSLQQSKVCAFSMLARPPQLRSSHSAIPPLRAGVDRSIVSHRMSGPEPPRGASAAGRSAGRGRLCDTDMLCRKPSMRRIWICARYPEVALEIRGGRRQGPSTRWQHDAATEENLTTSGPRRKLNPAFNAKATFLADRAGPVASGTALPIKGCVE